MQAEPQLTRLGVVPRGWSVIPLGTVLRRAAAPVVVEPRASYREIGIRSHGKGLFHKDAVTGASLGNKRVFEVVPGALVLNIVFAWEGAVAVLSEGERGMIASHRFPMFVPDGHVPIDIDFVRRFFQTKLGVRLLGEASPGGAGRNRTLNQKFVSQIPLPVPPIAEQRKIVAILAAVDNAIEATRDVVDQLQVVNRATMFELLTRGIPGRHSRFKTTAIGQVPEQWEVASVAGIAASSPYACVGGPFGSDLTTKDYVPAGVPVVRGGNLNGADHWVVEKDFVFVSERKADDLRRNLAYPGDIIFTQRGTLGQVARVRIDSRWKRLVLSQSQMKLTVDTARVHPDFVTHYFKSPVARDLITRATIATGIPHINLGILRAFYVPVPSLAEQSDIVAVLDAIEQRIVTELTLLDHLRRTRTSLMSALLVGEVRVTEAAGSR